MVIVKADKVERKTMKHNYMHIVKIESGWAGKREGSTRASFVVPTQAEAIAKGRQILTPEKGELFIHRPDGTLRERYSYGNDPSNRPG